MFDYNGPCKSFNPSVDAFGYALMPNKPCYVVISYVRGTSENFSTIRLFMGLMVSDGFAIGKGNSSTAEEIAYLDARAISLEPGISVIKYNPIAQPTNGSDKRGIAFLSVGTNGQLTPTGLQTPAVPIPCTVHMYPVDKDLSSFSVDTFDGGHSGNPLPSTNYQGFF